MLKLRKALTRPALWLARSILLFLAVVPLVSCDTDHPLPTQPIGPMTTPTPTRRPLAITLRAITFQWDWCPAADQGTYPCTPGVCPPSGCGPGGSGEITLHVGQTYQVLVYDGDLIDFTSEHGFPGVSAIGLQGGLLPQGAVLPRQTIMPQTAGDYRFSCTNYCGVNHDLMVGTVHVVP